MNGSKKTVTGMEKKKGGRLDNRKNNIGKNMVFKAV